MSFYDIYFMKKIIIKNFLLHALHITEPGVGLKSHPWTPRS